MGMVFMTVIIMLIMIVVIFMGMIFLAVIIMLIMIVMFFMGMIFLAMIIMIVMIFMAVIIMSIMIVMRMSFKGTTFAERKCLDPRRGHEFNLAGARTNCLERFFQKRFQMLAYPENDICILHLPRLLRGKRIGMWRGCTIN